MCVHDREKVTCPIIDEPNKREIGSTPANWPPIQSWQFCQEVGDFTAASFFVDTSPSRPSSRRPLVIASLIIAAHHVLLSTTGPDWLFPDGGGLARVTIHALAVVLQCSILCYIARALRITITAQEAAIDASKDLAERAELAQLRAEHAQSAAEQALHSAEIAEANCTNT